MPPRYGNTLQRPAAGARPDLSTGLGRGLLVLAPGWDGGGSTVQDVVGGNNLKLSGTTPLWTSSTGGGGISFTGVSAQAAIPTPLPVALQIQPPMTLVFAIRYLAAMTGGVYLWGYEGGPNATAIRCAGASTTRLNLTGTVITLANTVSVGVDYVMALTITSGAYAFYQYQSSNGRLVFSQTAANTAATTSWTNMVFGAGMIGSTGNFLCYWGALWNRALSASEVGQFSSVPAIGRLFTPAWGPELSAGGLFLPARLSVYANHRQAFWN